MMVLNVYLFCLVLQKKLICLSIIYCTKKTTMTSVKTSNQVSFSVSINRYQEFFEKFIPMNCQECINPNCRQNKQSAIKYIWKADTLIYKHNEDHMASTIAPTLNIITMLVNKEQFTVMSHYCSECFKQQVKKDRSARQRAKQEKRDQENQALYRLKRDLRLKEEEEKAKAQTNH